MAYLRPDVYIQEQLQQSTASFFPATSPAAFVGYSRQGPLVPTQIQTWADFQRYYGPFTGSPDDTLALAVYQFYANGGRNCWITRVVGAGAVVATRTYSDSAGTPLPMLVVTASNVGLWGNTVFTEVTASLATGRFNLVVRKGGSSDTFIVERFPDLSMNPADARYALSVVNSQLSGSNYITLALQGAYTYVAASSFPAPSPAGGDVLSGGLDQSTAPTLGVAGQWMAAVNLLTVIQDGFLLNLAGISDLATVNAAIAYIEARGDSFLIVDPQIGRTSAQAVTDKSALSPSGYAATYWPNLVISDVTNSTLGTVRTVSPSGSMLGVITMTDTNQGTQKAPAGISNNLKNVVGLENPSPSLTDYSTVAAGGVNGIRRFAGTGYVPMGASTLKPNSTDSQISVRRTLMGLEKALVSVTRFAVFENNDELLWGEITTQCSNVLRQLWQQRGLRGTTVSEAYFVTCDSSNNTPSTIASGFVNISVGVALQFPAQFILIQIGQFDGGANVTTNA